MNALLLSLALLFPATGPDGDAAAPAAGDLKPAAGQLPLTEDEVYLSVAKLQVGQGNYISQSDVICDHEGFLWIKADAKARSEKRAAPFAKGQPLVHVTKNAKGLAINFDEDCEWEPVQRGTLNAAAVLPCMSWTKGAPPKEEPKSKTKKGGLQ